MICYVIYDTFIKLSLLCVAVSELESIYMPIVGIACHLPEWSGKSVKYQVQVNELNSIWDQQHLN